MILEPRIVGLGHLAFLVDDLNAMYARLSGVWVWHLHNVSDEHRVRHDLAESHAAPTAATLGQKSVCD